jgi:hypothetical protein
MLLSKFTNFQKMVFIISMGVMLAWIDDYYFRGYCAFTIMENGGMPDYEPNFTKIFVIAILFMIGGAVISIGFWVFKKWFNHSRFIYSKLMLDAELLEQKMPLPFIDKFVWGATLLFLICLISLAGERFF